MARVRSEAASALRECLRYLHEDAAALEMHLVALHIRLAMTEADEVIVTALSDETAAATRRPRGRPRKKPRLASGPA